MNKKYLIAGGAAVVLLIVFALIIFFQQSSSQQQRVPQPATLKNQNPAAIQQPVRNQTSPFVSFAPPASTPQEAVKLFYHYYFASPENPLANGAYKNNPYLAPDFKGLIEAAYNHGNVPVFCPQNKRKNIIVGQEAPINSTNAILMQEFISEASPGNKDLYRVTVQQVNEKWLIFDINCIY